MRQRLLALLTLGLASIMIVVLGAVLVAVAGSEIEPNNDAAHATLLNNSTAMTGAITPTTDVDWFTVNSNINSTWGYIALLETISSTNHVTGTLTALRHDGSTVLQIDSGSWERGSGLALVGYADDGPTPFVNVKAAISGTTISTYTLRYWNTIVATQTEVEPNNTRFNATPSSFTMAGVISPTSDVDCFAFEARSNTPLVFAVNSDPENNGTTLNPVLRLYDPAGSLLKSADISGVGGKEFIEYTPPSNGIYTYCVSGVGSSGGPTATYNVGLTTENGLYYPSWDIQSIWLNPKPGNYATVGDVLSFRIDYTNTSPLTIPQGIDLYADFEPACLTPISAVPLTTTAYIDGVRWNHIESVVLPGDHISATINLRAKAGCNDKLSGGFYLPYFWTSAGDQAPYRIVPNIYLPIVLRAYP